MKKCVFFSSKSVSLLLGIITPLILLSCACVKSAKNKAISVDTIRVVRVDSFYRIQSAKEYARDSVYVHDSVYVASRGDTTYVERWHTLYKYIYQDTKRLDTLRVQRANIQECKHDGSKQVVTTKTIPYKAIVTILLFILLTVGLWQLSK